MSADKHWRKVELQSHCVLNANDDDGDDAPSVFASECDLGWGKMLVKIQEE